MEIINNSHFNKRQADDRQYQVPTGDITEQEQALFNLRIDQFLNEIEDNEQKSEVVQAFLTMGYMIDEGPKNEADLYQ